jgi:hypothetical protein
LLHRLLAIFGEYLSRLQNKMLFDFPTTKKF